MISETHWTILEDANRQLALRLVFHPVSNYRLLGFDSRGISMLAYAILAVEGRHGKEIYSEPE